MTDLQALLLRSTAVEELFAHDRAGTMDTVEPAITALRMEELEDVRHKDNLIHSIRVLENAIAREPGHPDLILRTAALFHDVGKPATREAGGKKTVTFDGHEVVGARMVKKLLVRHGYTPQQIKLVAELVFLHMRSHGFIEQAWTDTGVRRLMADVSSPEQLERLYILFYSDVTTRNKLLREEIHAGVDELRRRVAEVAQADELAKRRPAVDGLRIMEVFSLKPSRDVGRVMRYLNSEEGLRLTEEEALEAARKILEESGTL